MSLPLSVLDLVPLAEGSNSALRASLTLVGKAEALGFKRYWFAEHHNMPTVASTTPEVLIALAAERTSRIRVGSGGVMLPNHSPLKVAESFKMLEALYPGRIDLGIGRAPGTDPATALALRRTRENMGADDFPNQLGQLLTFGGLAETSEGIDRDSRLTARVHAIPEDVVLPPIWLLGSSDYGAGLAAVLGTGFGFAAHFSDLPPEIPMLLYRERFEGTGYLAKPHAILTLSVVCADTEEEAARIARSHLVAFARLRTGKKSVLLPPNEAMEYEFSANEAAVVEELQRRHIVGTPEAVRERIMDLAERTQADEIMITTFAYHPEDRMRSYELVAEAFSLEGWPQSV